jgi:hypothetical protein
VREIAKTHYTVREDPNEVAALAQKTADTIFAELRKIDNIPGNL